MEGNVCVQPNHAGGGLNGCPCPTICIFDIKHEFSPANFTFGFIPLQPLDRIKPTSERDDADIDTNLPFSMHRAQTPNCLGPRVPINTSFNLPAWEKYLHSYWDHQLIQFLYYGFPLDVQTEFKPVSTLVNHASAVQYASQVQSFLDDEVARGAILGPFSGPIDDVHCSPMMTRPKQGSDVRRVIVDLSWPEERSLNDHVSQDSYMGTPFILKFPVVDNILDRIKQLKGDCLLYKVDLKRAFRQLKIDPCDTKYTGLYWESNQYIDVSVPFGYRHGSAICQRVTDAIRYIMHSHGYYIFNYIDDLIGCDEPKIIYESYKFLLELLKELGLPISMEKLYPPDTQVPCLGININIPMGTISIPDDKLSDIQSTVVDWYSKTKASKRQLQSLVGQLLYIHKCVRSARVFVNRILDTLRKIPDKGNIVLSDEFRKDILWFIKFVKEFNGIVYYKKSIQPPIEYMTLDASLSGMGGNFKNMVYACPVNPRFNHSNVSLIVHLEMLNILIALRLWTCHFKHHRVLIDCDNMAVVYILRSGKTKDPFLAAVARNIACHIAQNDIELLPRHIPTDRNIVSDLLSRWFAPYTDRSKLNRLIDNPQWSMVLPEMCIVDFDI